MYNYGRKIKPSIAWYFVSAGILLIGMVVTVVILVFGLSGINNTISEPFLVPASRVFYLEPGNYNIYNEYRSIVNGTYYENYNNLSGLYCKVVNAQTQKEIAVYPSNININYSFPNREGHSIFSFKIEEAGNYTIELGFTEYTGINKTVCSVGGDYSIWLTITVLAAIGAGFGAFALSAVIFIVTLVKRKKVKEKILYETMLNRYKSPQ